MPKKNRISHSDFKLIANSRLKRERGRYFILSYGPLFGRAHQDLQIACIVSRKTAAKAVDRNLIKRRCRSAARNFLADTQKPQVLIFYANKNAKSASFADIKQDIAQLIERAIGEIS
ncbi:MAG: ribonuclease P protein component [Candidatus Kaiserbacteria bacterium]|nr:ribonuclease P protein component [Candidatus Kaiserbacteria bacterium]